MPAREILQALKELAAAGWRVQLTGGSAHAYARAYCPGGGAGCPPLTINATPRVPEHEAEKIGRAMRRCPHARRGGRDEGAERGE